MLWIKLSFTLTTASVLFPSGRTQRSHYKWHCDKRLCYIGAQSGIRRRDGPADLSDGNSRRAKDNLIHNIGRYSAVNNIHRIADMSAVAWRGFGRLRRIPGMLPLRSPCHCLTALTTPPDCSQYCFVFYVLQLNNVELL